MNAIGKLQGTGPVLGPGSPRAFSVSSIALFRAGTSP